MYCQNFHYFSNSNSIIIFFIQLKHDKINFKTNSSIHNVSGIFKRQLPFKISKLKFVVFKKDDFLSIIDEIKINKNILIISVWTNNIWVSFSDFKNFIGLEHKDNFIFFNAYQKIITTFNHIFF